MDINDIDLWLIYSHNFYDKILETYSRVFTHIGDIYNVLRASSCIGDIYNVLIGVSSKFIWAPPISEANFWSVSPEKTAHLRSEFLKILASFPRLRH